MSTTSGIGIQLTLKGAEQVKQGLKTISGSAAEMARQFDASRGVILTTAAAVATATGIMVDRVSTAAAEIERFAMLAGSTPQEFQRMAAGAKSAGMEMEKYASVMKDTQDKIGDFLQTGGGELKDFFEKIAPAVGVTAEQFKNLSGPQALQLFYNSLEKANLSQKETVFWMESIADDATALVPLLQNNGGAFDALADRAAKYGGVLSDYALAASKDFRGQTDEMTLALQGAEQILAVGLMPTLTETARELLATADSAGIADTAATVIRTTLEALVIVASDVAFTFTAVGREIGGMAAQAQAFLSLDFARAGQIGAMMKQDAATARAELEAFQARLLNAGQTAKDAFNLSGVMKGNKTGTAEYQAALNALIRMKDDGTVSAGQFTAAIKGATAANVSAAAAAGRTGKSLSGMGVGADAAKKAADTAKAAADKVASAYGTAWGNAAKLLRDVTAEEQNLNNAEKALADVMAGEHWAKFTAAQQAAAKAIYDRASAAIEARKIEEADAKWASESADANANVAESAYEAANAAEAQRDAQLQANAAIGLTALEVANLEAARIDDTAAEKQRLAAIMDGIDPAIAADYRRQAQALTELAEAKRDGAVKDAMAETAKEAADEWQRTADKIEDALIDALMDGGKSGAEYIEDLFRTMVLRPVLQAIVSPVAGAVTSALGLSGAAQAGQAGGMGGLSSLNTAYSAITTGIRSSIASGFEKLVSNGAGEKLGLSYYDGNTYQTTGLGEQFSGAAQGLGSTMTAYGLQKSLSGGYQTGEPGLVDAATAIGGFFDPTGGLIAGAIGGTVNRAFGRKLKDQGLEGTFGGADGFDGNSYEFYKGGWLRSDKTKRKALDSGVEDALETQFKALQTQTALMAQTLGLGVDSVADFTSKIKVSFKGLSEEQISERMAEEFGKVAESMASVALGTTEYTRTGETAVETLTRLSSSLTTVNGTFDVLGQKLLDTSLAGADMASQLVDLMGGLESFTATTASYLQNFYTEAERADIATRQLTEALAEIGINAMPTTREAYRALAEAQDITTESGRETYAALLGLSGAFAALVPAMQSASASVEDIEKAYQRLTNVTFTAEQAAEQRIGLEEKLLTLQGNTAELRRRELQAIDASNRGLQRLVWALDDVQTASASVLDAEKKLADAQAQAQQQQYDTQYEAAKAIADAARTAADEMKSLADTLRDFVLGETLTPSDLFADTLKKALGGDVDAMRALPQAANAQMDTARQSALTQADYAIARAQTLNAINQAASVAGQLGAVTVADPVRQIAGVTESTLAKDPVQAALGELNTAIEILTMSIATAVGGDLADKLGKIDTNLDGSVSESEFKAAFSGTASDNVLSKIFSALDSDSSNMITKLESIRINTSGLANAIGGGTASQVISTPSGMGRSSFESALKSEAIKNNVDLNSLTTQFSSFANGVFSSLDIDANDLLSSSEVDASKISGAVKTLIDTYTKPTSSGSTQSASSGGTSSAYTPSSSDLSTYKSLIVQERPSGSSKKYDQFVYDLYIDYARRQPDLSGFNYWVNTIKDGVKSYSESDVLAQVKKSFSAATQGITKDKAFEEQYNYLIGSSFSESAAKYFAGISSYAVGGYTGPGGKYEAAGVVHRGEVVFSQDDIARLGGVRAVEAIRTGEMPGYATGGAVGGPVVVPAPAIPGRVAMAPRPATPDPVQQEREAQARDQAQRDAQQQTQDLIAQLRQVNSNLTDLKRSVDKSGQANDQMNNKLYNTADTTLKLLRKFDALGLPVVQAATEAA